MRFKYTGILAKARKAVPTPGLLADTAAWEKWKARYVADHMALWRALYEAHNVTYGDMSALLIKMAETHVPGFSEARVGRRLVFDLWTQGELWRAIEDYRDLHRRSGKRASISEACKWLAEREPWKSITSRPETAGGKRTSNQSRASTATLQTKRATALRNQYHAIDPRWVKVIHDAREWDRMTLGQLVGAAKKSLR